MGSIGGSEFLVLVASGYTWVSRLKLSAILPPPVSITGMIFEASLAFRVVDPLTRFGCVR